MLTSRKNVNLAEANAQSGFSTYWRVYSDYTIKDGVIKESGKRVREYQPIVEPALPVALSRVARGEVSIEEFAHQFGLLGYRPLFPQKILEALLGYAPKAVWDVVRATLRKKELLRTKPAVPARRIFDIWYAATDGEPVAWIKAHANTVAALIEILGLIQDGDIDALAYTVRNKPAGPFAVGYHVAQEITWPRIPRDRKRAKEYEAHLLDPAAAPTLAAGIVRNYINCNISGIRRDLYTPVSVSPAPRGRSKFTFRAMIEAVYWQLADRLERGGIRRCIECGRYFVARDPRQVHCPPFPGAKRSRCSSRQNVRIWRGRQKESDRTERDK
jgi:hypothetical protein